MENEVSTADILKAIQSLEVRFDGLEGRFDGLEVRFDGLEGRFDGLGMKMEELHTEAMEAIQLLSTSTDERFTGIEKDVKKIQAEMVTKDYLDRKLADKEMDTLDFVKKTYARQ